MAQSILQHVVGFPPFARSSRENLYSKGNPPMHTLALMRREDRNPLERSLLALLTNSETPARGFQLSHHAGVICLTHVVRALNLTRAETLEELEMRRESAATLAALRIEIQREARAHHD
jgi:hypothetical protein